MSKIGKLDPNMALKDAESGLRWYDAGALTVEGKGWQDTPKRYSRLPKKAESLVRKPVWDLGLHSAGVCIRFLTDSPELSVKWNGGGGMDHMPPTGMSGLDLYMKRGGSYEYQATARPEAKPCSRKLVSNAGSGLREYILNLSLYNTTEFVEIGVPESFSLMPAPKRKDKGIVFYGTSITQGGCASRPGMAYTAIVGRRLDREVFNLGFSGNGMMEIELAGFLAELDPSLYVLDCLWNMTEALVGERVAPFVRLLRERRPGVPILLLEDASVLNVRPTPKGVILRRIFDGLCAEGVKGLHFMDNKGLLGDDMEGTVDGVHPTDLGFMRFADVLTPVVRGIISAP